MGNRLSKIYTRTGDDGTTGLGNGERVAKDSLRIETIGAVDELNCAIGRVLVHDLRDAMRECLQAVQHKLFDLGGELSIPGYRAIKSEDVERLAKNKILIDADPNDSQRKLLQIFTQNAFGPIFFEIIQRKGNEGFGEGNFQALFESIERDQMRRGFL